MLHWLGQESVLPLIGSIVQASEIPFRCIEGGRRPVQAFMPVLITAVFPP
jgi:hypothetical protein